MRFSESSSETKNGVGNDNPEALDFDIKISDDGKGFLFVKICIDKWFVGQFE